MAVVRTLLASGSATTNQSTFNVTISGATGRKLIFTGSGENGSGSPPTINNIQWNFGAGSFTFAAEGGQPSVPSNQASIYYYDVPDFVGAGTYQIVATWTAAQENAYAVTEVTGLELGGPDATGTNLASNSSTLNASATATVAETYGVTAFSCGEAGRDPFTQVAGTEYIEVDAVSSTLNASDENTFLGTGSKTMGWNAGASTNRLALAMALWEVAGGGGGANDDGAAGMMAANM